MAIKKQEVKLPVYSYICRDCKEKFNLFAGVGEKDEKLVCKKYGSKNIEKIFSSFAVVSSSDKSTESSCSTGNCPLG